LLIDKYTYKDAFFDILLTDKFPKERQEMLDLVSNCKVYKFAVGEPLYEETIKCNRDFYNDCT